jgi:uncharacterized protein YbaP (TraB family)
MKMNKNFRTRFIRYFVVSIIFSTPFISAISFAQDTSKTSIWMTKSETNTVYLCGSIHLLKESDFPPHPKMEAAFKKTPNIVFEVVLDSMDSMEMQGLIMQNALYPEGQSLKTQISDSLYNIATETAQSLNLDLTRFNGFKPWFVAMTFDLMKLQQLGFQPNFGIDRYFYDKAKNEGKNILGLESVRSQINLLTELDTGDQALFLSQSLEQLNDIENMINEILDCWKTGNLPCLETSLNKSFLDYPEMNQKFLINRNNQWMKKILNFLTRNEDYMIIVGAGHMAGEFGLIKQLEKAGFEVKQF